MRSREAKSPGAPIGALMKGQCKWFWLWCNRCLYHRPLALAPFAIFWGMNASTDLIRNRSKCRRCGHVGASMKHPAWMGSHAGWETFPTDWDEAKALQPLSAFDKRWLGLGD